MPNWMKIQSELEQLLRNPAYSRLLRHPNNPAGEAQDMVRIAQGSARAALKDPVTVLEVPAVQHTIAVKFPLYRAISVRGSNPYGHWWFEESLLRRWWNASQDKSDPRAHVFSFIEARMAIDKEWSYDANKQRDGLVDLVKLDIPGGQTLPAIVGKGHYQNYAGGTHPGAQDVPNVMFIGGDTQVFLAVTALPPAWVRSIPATSPQWPFA